MKWSRLAARQGHAGAQYQLGLLYAVGAGVEQDFVQAYKWFSLAAVGLEGIDGEIVATVTTDESGEFTATYTIPDFLHGQDSIAIRLESPSSGYYAYNWFYN